MASIKTVPIYDSGRAGSPPVEELREAFRYRHLILQLIRRDVLTRYKRSVLGIAWTMLNPLGMMLVWTIAFSQVFRFETTYSYAAYVLSGLLAWTFFGQTTTAAMVNLVWGGGLLNRIYIPRVSFAVAAIGTGLVNLTLSLFPLLLVMIVTRTPIRWSILFMPVPMLLLASFSLGMGLLISTVAVYFPDVAEMYQILLIAWMFLTPVMYPEESLPKAYGALITRLNPMYYLVKLYRLTVYYGRFPGWGELWPGLLISILVLLAGWVVFTKKSDDIAYRL
jgi:ABC-type polysaccharide/polyol phosphate export permease